MELGGQIVGANPLLFPEIQTWMPLPEPHDAEGA